ncbi:MAG: inositol monophosphatase [Bacteriovoracaceae bacterium]|nr:inositol monophosphatase [Bacteriovoracaceae bacterium]
MDVNKLLEIAIEAARRPQETLAAIHAGGNIEIVSQAGKDIKLQADKAAENVIVDFIRANSEFPILTEETGEHGRIVRDAPYWIVDPLDGSMNFSKRAPLYCTSIALWQNSKPILGVIYNPETHETFSGIVGQGAWLNGSPMFVSKGIDVKQAVLATGFTSYRSFAGEDLESFLNKIQQFKKIRMLGSAALMLAWVSCGRFDAYYEEDIMLWDVAAGLALALAAGGKIDICDNKDKKWSMTATAACNNTVLDNLK